jgi:3-hydroxybutyryl-CoA dehydratase
VKSGSCATLAHTIAESDAYFIAGVSSELHPILLTEEHMSLRRFGGQLMQGVLLMALMSAAASKYLEKTGTEAVSYGYDAVRLFGAALIGDSVSVEYIVHEVDSSVGESRASVEVTNQDGVTLAVATHIVRYVR